MAYTGEQKREYQRKWIAERRGFFFKDKVCVKCNSKENLELDHINPDEKKYNPRALWGMSDSNPNKISELEKCQVLCEDCHKEKTRLWWESQAQHGRTLYGKGCRCSICFSAQQKHNAQRYAAKA